MNISMHLILVTAACLCLADGSPDVRLTRKQQRPTRGFKNIEMMTARGFGKRDRPSSRPERDTEHTEPERAYRGTPTFKSSSIGIARDFGKRSPEEENYEVPPRRRYNPKDSLMVAHDFGKRSGHNDPQDEEEEEITVSRRSFGTFKPKSNVLIARGYGKRNEDSDQNKVYGMDNLWELLESSPEKDGQEGSGEKTLESIPLDWFVNEMLNNPDFTRSVVRKFVDLNQDGMLSTDELLRNTI